VLAIAVASCAAPAKPNPVPAAAPAPQPPGEHATVPLHLEGNRPFVDVTLRAADGRTRTARFLVDSGGGGFLLTEPLAKELGLGLGEVEEEEGTKFASVTTPLQASVGTMALDLDPTRIAVEIGGDNILPAAAPGHADGLLPGHVLAHYDVVFDYPAGTFTLARVGALPHQGTPRAMPVQARSGFPRTELEIDGTTHGFLVDTGASFTMVSTKLLEAWGSAHPDWPRQSGAVGEATTLGGQALETMTVRGARWGATDLGELALVSQQAGVFEKWMSSMTAAPIVGSLAGNVLKRFRLELDYPDQQLYVTPAR
jgi:hypothetical protein